MKEITKEEKDLISKLEKLGWKYGYLGGHGRAEPVSSRDGKFVIGDIEKSNIIIPPNCLYENPVPYDEYY
jgi:hypothetical protein